MNVRFFNARILTMADGPVPLEGELWVQGDRVTYVGPPEECGLVWDREIDACGNLLLPGFKNAHTHSAMTFLRSYADDLPLHQWLHQQIFPMEAKLTGEDCYWQSRLAILEYLTSGITANFDMYYFTDQVARASVESGFRTVFCEGLNDFASSIGMMEENHLKFNHFHPLISHKLGFHGEYTTSEAMLKQVAALAEKYHAPVYSHLLETQEEADGCLARHGLTAAVYLDRLGMYRYGGGGFHCIYLSPEDLEVFERRGLWAITNPGSNTKLASGIAPVARMLEKNIRLAIGTDGPASNNCLDFFREMFLVTGLQKLKNRDAASTDAWKVLKMACCDGALAMGLTDCDSLLPGKQADLVMLDLHQPNMQPLNDIAKNVVYSGSKQNVKLTMVAGKILYEDGVFHVGEDPEEIYRQVNLSIQAKK